MNSPASCETIYPSILGIIKSFPEEVIFNFRPKGEIRVGQAGPQKDH